MPKKTEFNQLSPKIKAFAEHYINTHNVTQSYLNAGYLEHRDSRDRKVRMLAYRSGKELLKNPLVRDFIDSHQPIPIPVQGDIDEKAITDRLFLICMGNIEQQYLVKGDLVYLKPTFKESIEAGKVLMMIAQKREKKEPIKAKKLLSSRLQHMVSGARMIEAPEEEEDSGVEQ